MKVLVTGARGFIGSYFIKKNENNFSFSTFSFRNNSFEELNTNGISTIVHLSALVHQMNGAQKEEYFKVNTEQTISLAKKAKVQGVFHFIFMSTVKVYGEEALTPYSEVSECNPCDDYGKSKLAAEKGLKELENENFVVSIIRTPIVYGHGVKGNIQSLLNLVNKVPLLPFRRTFNKRSMVYIGNLSHLTAEIIQQRASGIFLIQDEQILSTSDFIKLISFLFKRKTILITLPGFELLLKTFMPNYHKRLFQSLYLDNTKTIKRLNLHLPYSTKDGIKNMIYGER